MENLNVLSGVTPREGYRLTLENNKKIALWQENTAKVNLNSAPKDPGKKLDIKA